MRRWHRKSEDGKLSDSRLIRAAERGATSEVKSLLDQGANVVCYGEYGTPLHYACRSGFYIVASLLVGGGAPTNLFGETDYTPLHLACRGGYTNIVELLLKNSTTPNMTSKFEKRTAMHIAATTGHADAVRVLLRHGAHIDAKDIYGLTALHNAARTGCTEAVEVLMEYHADVNGPDNDGWTALHVAAQSGQDEVVKLLLKNGAYIDAQNRYGRTPLHWACLAGHFSTVDLLLASGANVNIPDINGKRASQICKQSKIGKILRIYENLNKANLETSVDRGQSLGQMMILQSQIDPDSDALSVAGSSASASTSPEGRSSAFPPTQQSPSLEDIELCYDSGIDDLFGQMCGDEIGVARSRYKGFLRTVSALLGVMESKTEAIGSTITNTLDGTPSVSYVDTFKQLYGYLQTVDYALRDFREELTAEGMAVERSISKLMKKCARAVEEKHEDAVSAPKVMFLHYIACTLTELEKGDDYWRHLYSALMRTINEPESEEFLEETKRSYVSPPDRIFSVLFEWLSCRPEDDQNDAMEQDVFRAVEECASSEQSSRSAHNIRKIFRSLKKYERHRRLSQSKQLKDITEGGPDKSTTTTLVREDKDDTLSRSSSPSGRHVLFSAGQTRHVKDSGTLSETESRRGEALSDLETCSLRREHRLSESTCTSSDCWYKPT